MGSISKRKARKKKKLLKKQLPKCTVCGRPKATLETWEETPRPLCEYCACVAGEMVPD